MSAVVVCLYLAYFSAGIGQFVRHARNNILARQSDGFTRGAIGRILRNGRFGQADAFENLVRRERSADGIDKRRRVIGIQASAGTFLVQSVYGFEPEIRETCAEFVHLLDGQLMIENKERVQMRMPAVDVGFGYFLGANETDFAEFIQKFDKGALLVDVAPDLKKFLADDFEFLAFFVA